ncbi:CMGC/CDK/CDK7 protein kinase [Ramicandelaber brevisporus]|nr:CMGC/CDK/CDK7 protein kinase [Ramicandelaber brevisporus]
MTESIAAPGTTFAATAAPLLGEDLNRSIEQRYSKIRKLGEGTFAVVYLGVCKSTGKQVAIKKIKVGETSKNGLDLSAVREVKALRELRHHPNVLALYDVYAHRQNLHLVLEFLDTDLEALIKDGGVMFMPADIKSWIMMALRGLDHMHRNWILHRDIKPNNMLLSRDGVLKLADFGLARTFGDPSMPLTSQSVTLWYRPPELLFGAKYYGEGVDIWSTGCVFAELMLRQPYMPGSNEVDQLNTIFKALGTPNEDEWPEVKELSSYVAFKPNPKPPMRDLFTGASMEALDLLERMLTFNPNNRPSAKDSLLHPYFAAQPLPTEPSKLPRSSAQSSKEPSVVANDTAKNGLLDNKNIARKLDFGR